MTTTASTDARTAARELITPERLRDFFAPCSIALVGASETSGWARFGGGRSAAETLDSGAWRAGSETATSR